MNQRKPDRNRTYRIAGEREKSRNWMRARK